MRKRSPPDQHNFENDDPVFVEMVRTIGDEGGSKGSDLYIIEVPRGVEWQICAYDGSEWVAEKHRTWGTHQGHAKKLNSTICI